jgi:hypothetical protein
LLYSFSLSFFAKRQVLGFAAGKMAPENHEEGMEETIRKLSPFSRTPPIDEVKRIKPNLSAYFILSVPQIFKVSADILIFKI